MGSTSNYWQQLNHQALPTFSAQNNVEYGGQVWVATIQSLVSRYKNGKLALIALLLSKSLLMKRIMLQTKTCGQVLKIFSNARFIGATATPCRLDGQGQHKDCGGLYDNLMQAEQLKDNATQWLIANGYLSDYEYWCPPTDGIDFTKLKKAKLILRSIHLIRQLRILNWLQDLLLSNTKACVVENAIFCMQYQLKMRDYLLKHLSKQDLAQHISHHH
jgi:hypothetical protein